MKSSYLQKLDYSDVLKTLCFIVNPKKIVEFGILDGYSLKTFIENTTNIKIVYDKYQPKKLIFAEVYRPLITKNLFKLKNTLIFARLGFRYYNHFSSKVLNIPSHIAVHFTFVLRGVLLAYMDGLTAKSKKKE